MGRRTTSRLRLRLPAQLITVKGTFSAILIDLSYFGGRVLTSCPPMPGTEALLKWDIFEGFGHVVWSGRESLGLNFFEPITAKMLLATRDKDDVSHLPPEWEINRSAARNWVSGQ